MELKRNEIAKDIEGYEGFYKITSLGRVWSCRRKKWLKICVDGKGYPMISLSVDGNDRSIKIHRLVAKAFAVNPEDKPQVNHKNGVKSDCRAVNLEWVTARENNQHACDMKLSKVYKTSFREKVMICKLYKRGEVTQREIADLFEITAPSVSYILKIYKPILANE